MNTILGFDTSNNYCSVAIMRNQTIISFQEQLDPNMQAANIVKMIESALYNVKLKYHDINYLALTNGPGSFTGIRIALSVAKGITLASNIKPIVISNFETSFFRAQEQVKTFDKAIIIINAYRNQVYLQEFNNVGYVSDQIMIDNDNIKEYILDKKEKKIICAGSGIVAVYDMIRDIDNLTILPRFPKIKAIHICKLADKIIHQGTTNFKIAPLYIRAPDAKKPVPL